MDTVTFTVEHEYEYEFAVVEDGKVVLDENGEAVLDTEYECIEREYEVEYSVEPAQNGGWDDPSWDESATAYGAYFRRANGLWYPIELTKDEAAELGAQYIKDCRWADDNYDAQARYDDRYDY